MKLKPLGWITVIFILTGFIFFIISQFVIEISFIWIWSCMTWGVISIFLTTWSFIDFYKPKDRKSIKMLFYSFSASFIIVIVSGVIFISN